jgi:lipid-A-disaccharide synthase
MKYYLIAGEASGDLHGSNLIREIKQRDSRAEIRCWGGDKMEAAGATLVKNYKDLAFMGFAEVLMNLRTILGNMKFCKLDIDQYKPDIIVMIDFPGFNLPIAKWAKPLGYKIAWYISPQVWAWKEKRVKDIKLSVDKMLCILPFEKDWFKKFDYAVEYVGHPLIEVISEAKKSGSHLPLSVGKNSSGNDKKIIALLPGSRKQEILKKLPVMLEVAKRLPDYHFVVAQAPGQEDAFYQPLLQPYPNVSSVKNATYDLLMQSTAALVTSGTATLETALFGVPQVVCYKANAISYEIAKRIIKIKYISLVNLIMDKPVVKELIQHDMNPDTVYTELQKILVNDNTRKQMKTDYEALWNLLAAGGNASSTAAEMIVGMVC